MGHSPTHFHKTHRNRPIMPSTSSQPPRHQRKNPRARPLKFLRFSAHTPPLHFKRLAATKPQEENPSQPAMTTPTESVQCFGRKKTAVAVTHCKRGRGLIKINGCPIELVEPEILRFKAYEPILLLERQRFAGVDMRIRVKGGGHTSQIYAIRQSTAKALVAFLPEVCG